MSSFDIEAATRRAKRLIRRRKIGTLQKVLVPITAHVASIITIMLAWFMRTGSFQFHPDSWVDWVVVLVVFLVGYSGTYLILGELSAPQRFVVRRRELMDLIAAARAQADVSVINISGDLSWLEEDYPITKKLRELNQSIHMTIYYDRTRVPPEMMQLLAKFDDLNVEFVPYPRHVSTSIRCMLVDHQNQDSRRLFVYSRFRVPSALEPRSEHLFLWEEYGPESSFIMSDMEALVGAIEAVRMHVPPIIVGVCGVNNVGKTQLCRRIRELLGPRLTVQTFADEFRLSGHGSSLEDAYAILGSQLMRKPDPGVDACLIDRTLIDNLCYLRLRAGQDDRVYRTLAPQIAAIVKSYDLVIDVQKSVEDYTKRTTFVTGRDRRFVRRALDEFFATYDIEKMDIVIDVDDFQQGLESAARDVCDKVLDIYQRQRLSD